LEEGFDLSGSGEGTEAPRRRQDISSEVVRLEKVQDLIDVDITVGGRRDCGLKLLGPFPCDLDGLDVFERGDLEVFDGREGGDCCCGHRSLHVLDLSMRDASTAHDPMSHVLQARAS